MFLMFFSYIFSFSKNGRKKTHTHTHNSKETREVKANESETDLIGHENISGSGISKLIDFDIYFISLVIE